MGGDLGLSSSSKKRKWEQFMTSNAMMGDENLEYVLSEKHEMEQHPSY